MRRKFLAHIDMKRESSKIEVSEMKELLEAICREFNETCDAVDDDRIVSIDKNNIDAQFMTLFVQFGILYSNIN